MNNPGVQTLHFTPLPVGADGGLLKAGRWSSRGGSWLQLTHVNCLKPGSKPCIFTPLQELVVVSGRGDGAAEEAQSYSTLTALTRLEISLWQGVHPASYERQLQGLSQLRRYGAYMVAV